MGLPALRAVPRVSVEPAGQNPRAAERESGRGKQGHEAFDLQTIVEAVFDPAEDRVIYELPTAPPVDGDGQGRLCVGPGEAIPATLACAAALQRLGRRRFVVSVVPADAVVRALSESPSWFDGALKRIVIVVLSGPGACDALIPVAAAGWRVIDLREERGARMIAKTLVATRYDESPTVVVLNAALRQPPDPEHVPLSIPLHSDRERNVSSALAAEFKLQMAADARLSAVVLADDPDWQPLNSGFAVMSGSECPLARGLMTALALAHAGCHPVVVARSGSLAAEPDALARVFAGRRFRGTLVVLDFDAESEVAVHWPEEWEHRVLTSGMDAAELRRVSADCLRAVRGTVLHVPGAIRRRDREQGASRADSVVLPAVRSPDSNRGVEAGPVLLPLPEPGELETVDFQGALSDTFLKWVGEYERVGRRGRYLWSWCQTGLEAIALSCVDPRYQNELIDTKLISVMYGVMLDDVADEMQDPQLLEWLGVGSKDPAARDLRTCPPERRAYADLTFRIWDEYEARVRRYPRYREFERLLRYDNDQVLNTMRYSSLVNQHATMMNSAEHDAYAPHNMQMMTFATVDLMCSPGFELSELGIVRSAMWHAQCMGRIGNMVSTWERELGTGDLTSGVLARLVETGGLSPGDLRTGRTGVVRKAVMDTAIEQFFLGEWQRHRTAIEAMVSQVRSVDLGRLISGLDRLIRMELGSRGLK